MPGIGRALTTYLGALLFLGGFVVLVLGTWEALGGGWAAIIGGTSGIVLGAVLGAADATSRRSMSPPSEQHRRN